jgi:anaerobic glycerol-3-phosphate dehydrogenase
MEVVAADAGNGRVTAVWTEAAARRLAHRATSFVLATGGILGGSITADHGGQVREVVLDLPLSAPPDRSEWFRRGFLEPDWQSTQPFSPWTREGRSCTKICMPPAQPWLTVKPCANALWRVWRW